jgi:hypothetical protein
MSSFPTRDVIPADDFSELLQLIDLKALFQSYSDFPPNFTQPYTLNPHYVPPDRGSLVLGVAIAWLVLAIIVVSTRIYLRARWKGLRLGWDDWFIVPSLVLAFILTIVQVVCVKQGGLGRHVYDNFFGEIGVSLKVGLNLILIH